MTHRLAAVVRQKILLGDVGDVFGFVVLGEQMIERLILVRADFSRDRLVPFFRVAEDRINVEHDAAERIKAVTNHLADLKFGVADLVHDRRFPAAGARCLLPSTIMARRGRGREWSFITGTGLPFPGLLRQRAVPGQQAPWPASRWRRLASCRRSSRCRWRRASRR